MATIWITLLLTFKNTFSNLFDSYKEETTSSGNASRGGLPMGRSSESIPISDPHNLKINQETCHKKT